MVSLSFPFHITRRPLSYWRDDFLACKRSRHRPKTSNDYRKVINQYIAHVGDNYWPPTRFDVIDFLTKVEERASLITAASYWSILRAWFNYMEQVGAFGRHPNPATRIQALGLAPKVPKTMPRGVPKEHLSTLFDYLRSLPPALTNLRDLAMLHFIYRTGARSGEAANLRREQLFLKDQMVTLRAEETKNYEDRVLYFGATVRRDLETWLSFLSSRYDGPWVFPASRWGTVCDCPLTVSGVRLMFRRRLRQAGLPMYRVHDLRHSFTKEAIRAGKPLDAVRRQLGHATTTMVLRYAQVFANDQREAFISFGDD